MIVVCSNVYVVRRLSLSLSMAALRCAHLLFRNNVVSVRTLRIPQRTLWTLNGRGWAARLGSWSIHHSVRPLSSKPPQPSLAEELLASKVKGGQEGQEAQGEQNNEKTQEEREKTFRTLKYSFLAFGVMMTSMGGFLIWSWGQCHHTHTHTHTHTPDVYELIDRGTGCSPRPMQYVEMTYIQMFVFLCLIS